MSHLDILPPPVPPSLLIVLFSLLPAFALNPNPLPVLPNPDPQTITTFHPSPNPNPSPYPRVTIPSFPEQTSLSGCPIHLPANSFPAIKSSCTPHHGQLSHTKCCPVLASWLYSAYSHTALGTAITGSSHSTSFEMPALPDDSETCVDSLEDRMRQSGLNLIKPNESCSLVYCFCGIRLHPLSCSSSFRVDRTGNLVGDARVHRLERNCFSNGTRNGTRNRLARCSKCLHSLYSLKKPRPGSGNATVFDSRTQKMRGRDCVLMGLTWLLNKNRDAYMSTVTEVMRALMLNSGDSDPLSCSLSSDGMPLAVDSAEINDESSSSVTHQFSTYLYLSLLVLPIMYLSHCF